MTKITREYALLDREDVEQAVSKAFGKPVKLEDMEVVLYDCFSLVWEEVNCLSFKIKAGDMVIPKNEFVDDNEDYEEGPLDPFIDGLSAGTEESLIFNFSTDLFKTYMRRIDCSD